jgi:hypothetical protein
VSSRPIRIVFSLLAALGTLLAACGDDVPAEDTRATVPDDDDGAIGEEGDDDGLIDDDAGYDSQTNTTDLRDEIVPASGEALVNGDFGDVDIRLELTEDARCAIDEAPDAGGEAAAEVTGATATGDRFELDWSVDDGFLEALVEIDGTTWRAREDLDEAENPVIRLTRNGEVYFEATFEPVDGGETRDALLFVNCRPETT